MTRTENEKIAEVEALFRAGNDRMASWPENQERAQDGVAMLLFCECGRRRCREHIRLTTAQYEAVRADPVLFVLAPGHDLPEAEDVVQKHDEYVVVKKHEDVRAIVERLNLRADPDR